MFTVLVMSALLGVAKGGFRLLKEARAVSDAAVDLQKDPRDEPREPVVMLITPTELRELCKHRAFIRSTSAADAFQKFGDVTQCPQCNSFTTN